VCDEAVIVEKSRLVYDFMHHSLLLCGQVRQHLRAVLEPYTDGDLKRPAAYGAGQEAALAYLSLTEFGLEMVAVLGADGPTGSFLGQSVRAIAHHADITFDLLPVTRLHQVEPIVGDLVRRGVPRERLITLQQ
jgi:hypothetical protein